MATTFGDLISDPPSKLGIREQLRKWQTENGQEQLPKFEEPSDESYQVDVANDLVRLAAQDDFRPRQKPDEEEEEVDIPMTATGLDEEDEAVRRQYLKRGDLVELSYVPLSLNS